MMLWHRLQAALAPLTGAFLTCVVGWQLGAFAALQFSDADSVVLSNQVVESWLIAGQRPDLVPSELAYQRLFDQEDMVQEPVKAPSTPLKMVLRAVFVAPDNADSGAIIATLNKKARYYKTGDEVESGIYLKTVYDDRVLLNRKGHSEVLYFRKSGSSTILSSVQRLPEPKVSVAQRTITSSPPSRPAPGVVQNLPQTELGSDIRRLNAAAFMRKYQKKMQEDPVRLLSEAGITPAANGGYQVGDSPYASLLTSAGLEMGDVILSVNGTSLGDPQSDAQLLGTLSQKQEVEVMIQRGSRQFAVTFPVTR
ncbi:type II secretion system protein N [Oceanospirillum sp.]|uniref:type II secretion system protein N n=1 Tax=Oceanospirillum sp. TaxID=2021254 RepID=UPI003A949034